MENEVNVSMELQGTEEKEEESLLGGSGVRKMNEFQISHGFVSDSSHPFIIGPTSRIIFRNITNVILKAKINILLPFGPLAIILHSVHGEQVMFNFH